MTDLRYVSFGSFYRHQVERPTSVVLGLVQATSEGDTAVADSVDDAEEECVSTFRGLPKGYRLFKDGHVHEIQYHARALPDLPRFCQVKADVLPS